MAKSNPRSGRTPARAAAKSKKTTTVDVEVVEDAPGMGIDAGIAILTTIVLVAAILMVDALKGKIDSGIFFH